MKQRLEIYKRKNQTILELKNTISEIKNLVDCFHSLGRHVSIKQSLKHIEEKWKIQNKSEEKYEREAVLQWILNKNFQNQEKSSKHSFKICQEFQTGVSIPEKTSSMSIIIKLIEKKKIKTN